MNRLTLSALMCTAAFAVAAPAADAGTLSYEGDTLVYQASPGETNVALLYPSSEDPGSRINFADTRAASMSLPADKCTDRGEYGIDCDKPAKIRLDLNDGSDGVDFGSDFPKDIAVEVQGGAGNDELRPLHDNPTSLTLDGGPGNDKLEAGDGNQTLRGGPGNDELTGRGGDDVLEGGEGDDMLKPDYYADTPGNDVVDGGPGNDRAEDWSDPSSNSSHPPISITMDGQANDGRPGEQDNVISIERIDSYVSGHFTLTDGPDEINVYASTDEGASTVDGRGGNDRLSGNNYEETIDGGPGDDRVEGGYGNDTLTGGPGRDQIFGDDTDSQCGVLQSCTVPFGNDTIDARDGEQDTIDCGVGDDRAVVDPIDVVAANCETVDRGTSVTPGNPATCIVPKVKGLKLAAAKKRIAAAGCRTTVRKARSRTVKRGRVIKASAKPGTRLAKGSVVKLTVSRGR